MARPQPRLVILMPVYNDQDGLARSLASLGDDGASFDVVVVDDGSTPPLVVPDALPFRVELVRLDTNLGIVGALNAGLAHIAASGAYPYVARLDAGDLSLPGRLTAQMAFLDEHPDHAVVGGGADHVDHQGRFLFTFRPPTSHPRIVRYLRYRSPLVHASVMLRRSALDESGGYDPRFAGAEDLELYLRLAKRFQLGNLATVVLVREISPTSITSRRHATLRVRLRVLRHHFAPRSPDAYAGIVANLGFFLLPRQLVLRLRSAIGERKPERQHSKVDTI